MWAQSVWGQDRGGSDLSQNTDKDFNVAILPFVHQRVSVGRQTLEDGIAQKRGDWDMAKGDKGNLHPLGSRSHQTQQFSHGSRHCSSRAWSGGVGCFHYVNVLGFDSN